MIKIIKTSGEVKENHCYQSEDESTYYCPFCKTRHKLQRYGSYARYVVIAAQKEVQIYIQRLYCCIEKKQYRYCLIFVFRDANIV